MKFVGPDGILDRYDAFIGLLMIPVADFTIWLMIIQVLEDHEAFHSRENNLYWSQLRILTWAYPRVEIDSSNAVMEGDNVAIKTVLHLPPRDSCNILVSFESLIYNEKVNTIRTSGFCWNEFYQIN